MNIKEAIERQKEIIHLRELGYSLSDIGRVYRLSRQRIQQITKETIVPRKQQVNYRVETMVRLGGKCSRCGFSDGRALQIDHINGGGTKEAKSMSPSKMYKMMYLLPDTELKSRYQVLCANCNWIKRAENKETR